MKTPEIKIDVVANESAFASGVRTHLAKKVLTINKASVKGDAIAAQVEKHVALIGASELARTRWLQAVAAEREAATGVKSVMRSVKAYALATFGEDSPEYTDFGFAPKKKRVQTPSSKVEAAEKLRATRAARHTMGKKQRLAVKGSVTSSSTTAGAGAAAADEATGPTVVTPPAPIVVVASPAAAVPANGAGNGAAVSNGVNGVSGYTNGANGSNGSNGSNGYVKTS